MSRSAKKQPFVAPELMKRIEAMNESGKKEVLKTLQESLKQDRAKTQIMEFTKLSLLEMTRKHMFSGE